ncbi:MAG: serine/threonine-protein kinase, partial [Myxococcales bacterium]
MPLSVGEVVLDRYAIEALVGVGGMGEVYRARHLKLGMPVAVKAITGEASADLVRRFAREAQLLARVRHPNVVSILDVGETASGGPCMVMEFLEGEALDDRLERRGALPWQEVRAVALSILKGLDAIHSAGIIHRDLKPANVLITRGNPEVVKLVDFGIAHPSGGEGQRFTQTGAVVGTPAYMSPEQLVGGSLDARSDIYAVALLLYELLTGALPFGDEPNAALRRLNTPIPSPRQPGQLPPIPRPLVGAVLAALAVDANQRPADARAFYALLRGQRGRGGRTQQGQGQGQRPARGAGTRVAQGGPPPPPPPRPAGRPPAGTRAARGGVPAAEQGGSPAHADPAVGADAALGGYTEVAPRYVPSPTHAAPCRVLVAARVPVSRLASRAEQRALAQLAAPGR